MLTDVGKARWDRHRGRWYLDFGRRAPRLYSVPDGTGGRVSFADERHARRVLDVLHSEAAREPVAAVVARRQQRPTDRLTVLGALPRWLAYLEAQHAAGSVTDAHLRTQRTLGRASGPFSWWGDTTLEQVTPEKVAAWTAWLVAQPVNPRSRQQGTLKPKTIRHLLAALKVLMKWAHGEKLLAELPAYWPKFSMKRAEPKHLTADETAAVLGALLPYERGLFLACATLGLRLGEAGQLTVSDMVEGGLRISRGIKTGKPRTLPIPPPLVEWLCVFRNAALAFDDEMLFPNPRTGGPWSATALARTWSRACLKALGRKVRPRILRASFATGAWAAGTPAELLAAIMGHSSFETTRRHYAALDAGRVRDAVPTWFPAPEHPWKALLEQGKRVAVAGFEPATRGL